MYDMLLILSVQHLRHVVIYQFAPGGFNFRIVAVRQSVGELSERLSGIESIRHQQQQQRETDSSFATHAICCV